MLTNRVGFRQGEFWSMTTIVNTHFCNNIRYFRNFKLSISIVIARDSRVEIYGYGNINLAIKVGK